MFFRFFYPCLLLSLMISSIIISSSIKVEAISPPIEDPRVDYAKVFRNVREMGDEIFVCRYLINYAYRPLEDANESFYFCIQDTATTKFIVQRPLAAEGYGYNAQIVYLTAADVTSLGIVWGGSYNAVITSSPTLFSSVYEGSKFLDVGSWFDSYSVADGKSKLKDSIIANSRSLEMTAPTLGVLTASTTDGYKLTVAGKNFWQLRYFGTNDIPNLSVNSAQYMTVDNQSYTGSYLNELAGTGNLFAPTSILNVKDSFTVLGDAIGIPYWQVIAFVVLIVPSFLIVSGTVYGISGNSKLAAIIAAPVMFVISMLVPDALLMMLTAIVAFIVVVIMWRFI